MRMASWDASARRAQAPGRRCFPREVRLEPQGCVNGAGLSSHGRVRPLALALHEPPTRGRRRLPPESGVAHAAALRLLGTSIIVRLS